MAKRNGIEFNVAEDGTFTITGKIPENPPLSNSQKNFLLASSNGNWGTGAEFNGEEIYIGLNMYAKVSELKKKPEAAKKKK